MSSTEPLQNAAGKAQSASKAAQAGLLLQRKCACGGSGVSSLTGECEECKKKRLQKKLSIGASNDPLEQEADRVADQVLAMSPNRGVHSAPLRIQRATGQAAADAGMAAPASVDRVLAGSGRPLDTVLQQDMGQRFGHDFSHVRVHTGAIAEQSARDVNAHAYTVGDNIVFGAGTFAPTSRAGQTLIAHELAHVVQQNGAAQAVQRKKLKSPYRAKIVAPKDSHGSVQTCQDVNAHGCRTDVLTSDMEVTITDEFVGGAWLFAQHLPKAAIKALHGQKWIYIPAKYVERLSEAQPAPKPTEQSKKVTDVPIEQLSMMQSIDPERLGNFSNEEIDRQIGLILDRLRNLKPDTPEYKAMKSNLKVLEDELDARGYQSPLLIQEGLVGAADELAIKFSGVEESLAALFAPAILNQGAIDLFKKQFGKNGTKQTAWIVAALNDATMLALGASGRDRNAAFEMFGAAGTRVVAAAFGAQLLSVWVAFLKLSDVVLRGIPSYPLEALFVKMYDLWPRFAKPFRELSSFDSERVQKAAVAMPALLDQLISEHNSLVNEVETAVKRGQKVMMAAAIVELLTNLAAMRISLPPSTGGPPLVSVGIVAGGVTTGGALVGGRLVVTVEWVEMIRRLIAAGVIAAPVAAAGVRAGILMMASSKTPGVGKVVTGKDVLSSGTEDLQPGKSALGEYGIDKYSTFSNRPSDKFAGHELLENLWLEVKGYVKKRLVGPISRNNPAVALTQAEHAEVGRQQYRLGLFNRQKLAQMSAEEVIEANAEAMKKAGIPDYVIETLKRESLSYAATLKLPSGAVP